MATDPPPALLAPISAANDQRLDDALRFAQALADRELAAIDRLHARTLRYIGYVITLFAAGFGVLGYFGYKNLHDLAVGVATRQVKAEAARQVQQQLTKEGITEIVHQQTHDFAEGELHDQLHTEITTGPLHREIISTAASQSKGLIVSMFGQRHFTAAQAITLKAAIGARDELTGYPVTTRPMPMNLEAESYARDISSALLTTKIVAGDANAYSDAPGLEGVVIYYDEKFGDQYAESLAGAFETAGVRTKIKGGSIHPIPAAGGKPTLLVFVGPRGIATQ